MKKLPVSPTALSPTQNVMKQIIMALWEEYNQWKDSDSAARVHEICEDLYVHWSLATQKQVEALFSKTSLELSSVHAFIYLKPVLQMAPRTKLSRSWMVPLLTVSCDFNSDFDHTRLRLMLFMKDQQHNKLQAIGFRFESPESEGDGLHNYYHAQLISAFDKDGIITLPPCPVWLPVTQPAFALDATSPLGLLICMLVSLYGPEYVWDNIIAEHAAIIKSDLREISWLKRPRAPVFSSPYPMDFKDTEVDNLINVEGTFKENDVGEKVDRIELVIMRVNDDFYWNGQTWAKPLHPLKTTLSANNWRCEANLTKDKLKRGTYRLRACIYDKKQGINSAAFEVSVKK